jgi:hydrogenase nickel incorporation protein HypA/HybF
MHEMGIAAEVYRIARETADGRGGGALESVAVLVGELSAVEPELLTFAWEAIVGGGPDEGARLVIECRRARQLCPQCGEIAERAPGSWLRLCPRCNGTLSLEGGDELDVRSVVFEGEERARGGAA